MSDAIHMLVKQHLECDDQLNRSVAALQKADLASAGRNFRLFLEFLESHLTLEEQRLFPAFEQATGITQGPTVVMRDEHQQMRQLSQQAYQAIESGDTETALAILDTLNILIQQHNVKEENILYPMCGGSVPHLKQVLGMAGGGCGGGGGGVCSCSGQNAA